MLAMLGLLAKVLCPEVLIVGNLHTDWQHLAVRHRIGLHFLAAISDRFLCVSNASLNSIPNKTRRRIIENKKAIVIHNGIDIEGMRSSMSEIMSLPCSGKVVAIIVARMVAAKNCLFLLKLLKNTDAINQVIWYGDGPLRPDIQQEIKRLGIQARITLMGNRPRSEVFYGLTRSTLYLSASRWEGIGVANLEAAALGCQPFLSKIPAHDEIAEKLRIATYPLVNMEAWINGINKFLSLPRDLRNEMQRSLTKKAGENFDLSITVKKYLDTYKELSQVSNG
jgi:glycosyltransferase involved in cell wall biosynthesis